MQKHFFFMSQKSILVSFFLLLSLFSLLPAQSGLKVGEWRDYISYRQATEVVYRRGTAYAIVLGGMFSYTPSTEEVRTFSTIQGLHSTDPTRIFHDEITGLIFIGFADGTINYFSDPDDIRFLTDIQRNNFFTQKEINAFAGDGERLYVATDFGVVIYDLESFLTAFTITQFGENPSKLPVNAIAINQGRIWLSLGDMGLYSAPRNAINLSDPSIWRREDGENGLPLVDGLDLASLDDQMYLRVDTTVYVRDSAGQWTIDEFLDREWDYLSSQQGSVTASKNSTTRIVANWGGIREVNTGGRVFSSVAVGDTVFLANFFNGLQVLVRGQTGFEAITPDGPYTNNCTRVVAGNGEFYVAPKGHDEAFNPSPDASGIFYHNQSDGWTLLNKFNGSLDESGLSERFARAYYNPNSRTAYLGSWGQGVMELKDGVPITSYTCENSGLSQVTTDCNTGNRENTRVSGLAMDPDGNLWVSMSFAQAPLAVRLANGEWFQYPANLFPNNNFIDLIVDDYGSKWILNRRNGVWIFNDNGTPTNLADDVNLRLTSGLNEGFLPSDNVLSIAKDQDGFVWVGTDVGVTVFFDPFSISQGIRVDGSCPVFELRCLLKDEQINAIAVDGGNRKWMATNNGVFLVSEDGDELIANFTIENSPLLSNNVLDVTVDNQTGEVFFATEKGLVSYQGDATAGAENCDDVLVYPNPVFRSFDGMITIKGSSSGSKVKITTASGMLVQELEAQGGTATWNGMDLYGNKVASGIYLALISRDDGSKACIGKFSVINR
jgi:hypothetical protein